MTTALAELLADRQLIVMVGEGGVGKTSVSAAIAYARACRGDTVGVLTVDPAPRLGDALGVPSIDALPTPVALPACAVGTLVAMRLDSKRTFDRMVERYSPSPAAAQALLDHPIYRAVCEQLGGSENFAAFQRLHELIEEGGRDCLVVDTPPAVNARELLAAPGRLTGLLDTRAFAILADPALALARVGGALTRATLSLVLAALERATGASLQRNVSEFVSLFAELASGLEVRTRDIDDLLRADGTAFVLVTRPRAVDVAGALAFHAELARMGIRVTAIVVNRVTPACESSNERAANRLAALPKSLRGAVLKMEADMGLLRATEGDAIARLRRGLTGPNDPPVLLLSARDIDIASLDDIAGLAAELGC